MNKKSDDNEPESEDAKIAESKRLIRAKNDNINLYNNLVQSSCLLINGDTTTYGHTWQWAKMWTTLHSLNRDHFWGLGNYDTENNQNDCINDSCFAQMIRPMAGQIDIISKKTDIQISSDISENGYMVRGTLEYSIDFVNIFHYSYRTTQLWFTILRHKTFTYS